jgi:hypothetical protein
LVRIAEFSAQFYPLDGNQDQHGRKYHTAEQRHRNSRHILLQVHVVALAVNGLNFSAKIPAASKLTLMLRVTQA